MAIPPWGGGDRGRSSDVGGGGVRNAARPMLAAGRPVAPGSTPRPSRRRRRDPGRAWTLPWSTRVLNVFPEPPAPRSARQRDHPAATLLHHLAAIPAFEELEDYAVLLRLRRAPSSSNGQRSPRGCWSGHRDYPGASTLLERQLCGRGFDGRAGHGGELGKAHRGPSPRPLGLDGWFGWPDLAGADEPGHQWSGQARPPRSERRVRGPAAVRPAGDISLDLAGHADLLDLHLDGLRGADGSSTPAPSRAAPAVGDYACGWSIGSRDGHAISVHFGSAGTFLCGAVVCAERNLAFAVIANSAHAATEAGIAEIMDWIWGQEGGTFLFNGASMLRGG